MAGANRVALLVGCNYSSNQRMTNNQLQGCINDVHAMQTLIRHRFGFEDITILTEETGNRPPTGANIIDELTYMITGAKSGDILLFYFSGDGALVNPTITNESRRGIPAIIASDLLPITAAHILPIINLLKDGAFFTFICDSSYSGGLFDENVQIEFNVPDDVTDFGRKTIPSNLLKPINNVSANLPEGISGKHIILISSCRANEESVEVYPNGVRSKAISAFSTAIQVLFNSLHAVNPTLAVNGLNAPYANREVAAFTIELLGFLGFYQHPYLRCSDNDAAALFLGGYQA